MQLEVNDETVRIQYLKRQLTDEQEQEFEEYLMEHPDMVRELEITQALLDTAHEAFAKTETAASPLAVWWQKLRQPLVSFPLGMGVGGAIAALLLLAVLPDKGAGIYSSPNVVFLETTKGSAEFETQVPMDNRGMATLFIQTADIETTEYRMELLNIQSGQVLQTQQVVANGNGELVLVMDFSLLPVTHIDLALNNMKTEKRDVHRLVILRP